MEPLLKLICLGVPQVWLGDTLLSTRLSGKALALFMYVALTGQIHSRDLLADLLWSEQPNQQARSNLRYLLPELRKAVGVYLHITPQTISFNRQTAYWLDSEVLQATLTVPPAAVSTVALQAALDLYQEEFLAGFSVRNAPVFETWLVQQRAMLHELAMQGLYTLAERYQQAGNLSAGLATTQRLLQWEPWHEAAHRLQMQLLAATGQRTAALAQYVLCRRTLVDELGVEPEPATTALYEQIRTGAFAPPPNWPGNKAKTEETLTKRTMPNQPAVLASLPVGIPSLPHNLPSQLTPFIGREMEIAELHATLFNPTHRLINLVGEGGVGKTRLALAVAQALADVAASLLAPPQAPMRIDLTQNPKFPDGVWFVALGGITATDDLADHLATAVAKALGWQFSGRQPLLNQLITYLRSKALLLLFDNAEHLLPDIGDFLVTLLQNCPSITLLVTSRHILNLQAETVWRVSGLAVPANQELVRLTPAELTHYSSIALFVERASRIWRGFQVTAQNGAAITAICQLVEGLPLAIELAAAITKQYTCPELYAALQRDYSILAINFADLSPRHRSIQAMLDYSWRFLTSEEAQTLAACALFAGGFTLAAATAVTGATATNLGCLVDQSLLQAHAGRFSMHELVRQYAAAQLARQPERQAASLARHAAYYMDLLASVEAALLVDVAAQDMIQRELDNIRSAWDWSIEQKNIALLKRGATSLQCFYRLAGLYGEAIHLLGRAITTVRLTVAAEPAVTQPICLLAHLLCHATQFYRRIGKVETGESLAQEALVLGRQLAVPAVQALAYHELARLAQVRSDFLAMYTLAEHGCTQARQAGLPQLTAECLNDLGIATSSCLHPRLAIPKFHEALSALQGTANHYLEARLFGNLGFFHLSCHEYHRACRYLLQAFALQNQLKDREGSMITQILLGDLWTALGVYAEARQEYEQVLTQMQTIYDPYWNSWLHASYGRLQHLCGDPAAAYTACVRAQQIAQKGRSHIQKQWILVNLGHALADLENWAAASDCYHQAIALQSEVNWTYRLVDAQAGFAALLLAQNESATAISYVEAALAILDQQGIAAAKEPFQIYWTCVQVLLANGDPRAAEVLRTAYQRLQEIAHTLEDEALRRAFLENVVANRALCAAASDEGYE